MNMIVAYDIADPKRLQRIAKVMKDYGVRVQQSIFEVEVTEMSFREMRRRAELNLEPSVDGVKYFPLCERCSDTLVSIGLYALFPDEGEALVV